MKADSGWIRFPARSRLSVFLFTFFQQSALRPLYGESEKKR